jgi:hypothetical protein
MNIQGQELPRSLAYVVPGGRTSRAPGGRTAGAGLACAQWPRS